MYVCVCVFGCAVICLVDCVVVVGCLLCGVAADVDVVDVVGVGVVVVGVVVVVVVGGGGGGAGVVVIRGVVGVLLVWL